MIQAVGCQERKPTDTTDTTDTSVIRQPHDDTRVHAQKSMLPSASRQPFSLTHSLSHYVGTRGTGQGHARTRLDAIVDTV
jgi:hypothetical protein